MSNRLMPNYKRLPVTFTRGEGAWLWDSDGKRYLDALGGVEVSGLGRADPAVRDALCVEAGLLLHTSNVYQIAHQQTLADRLTQLAGMDTAFFCNSGAEANEAAIKLARLWGHQRGIDLPKIIVTEGSFHGRTLATLSATGNHKIQMGFEPLVQGFVRVPYNDVDSIHRVAEQERDVVAMLVEPVQGEGGVRIPDADYLARLRVLCDQHEWLLMLDEVQTGIGRTGRWFGFQHAALVPDVMCLAKGLGNGVPIGACLAKGKAAQLFQPGTHGSTFGGNPLACRAALAVLDTMTKDDLPAQAAAMGRYLHQGLARELAAVAGVEEIRSQGLMLGIELTRPCAELVGLALAAGLLINVTAERVVRLLPPLILDTQQADQLIAELSALIRDFLATTA